MELVLIRHAESTGNLLTGDEQAQLPAGTAERPLSSRGEKQAIVLGEWLREEYYGDLSWCTAYASPYRRATETARLALPEVSPREDSLLVEHDSGIWANLTRAEIEERYPDQIRMEKRLGHYWYRPLSGESYADVEQRFRLFLQNACIRYEDPILVFTHAKLIRIAWRYLMQRPIEHALEMEDNTFPNASLTILENRSPATRPWRCDVRGWTPPEVAAIS